MQTTIQHINKATILTILTVGLAALQSYLLHIGTTDYAHEILSVYFYFELFILILTISTRLKNKIFASIYSLAFVFEAILFFINELPISPDVFLMLIIGAIRLYILYELIKQQVKK